MKIASFKVRNLFDRAMIFNQTNFLSEKIPEKFTELGNLFEPDDCTDAVKIRMLELMDSLNLDKSDTGRYVILWQLIGQMIKRPGNAPIEIFAKKRKDGVG